MHISLETFNQLFAGKIDRKQREHLMDHVLGCGLCAERFKVLNQLDREMSEMIGTPRVVEQAEPRFRVPLKYALGVAAVMVMAVTPYLGRRQGSPEEAAPAEVARVEPPPIEDFSVLDSVRKVNLQASLGNWNENPDVRDLITKLE